MRGFKSIFVSSKHKIKCFLIHEKIQTTNAVDTLPLTLGSFELRKSFWLQNLENQLCITQNASSVFVEKIFDLKVGSCAKIERDVSRIALRG